MSDLAKVDFFRDQSVVPDPYPYYEALRAESPVYPGPHYGVTLITGYEEAIQVWHDPERFSSCTSVTGPFPGFPVPLEGYDDVSALIDQHRDELPMSDQLPTMDPPVHGRHRALLMKLITPKRLKENEEYLWDLADRVLLPFLEKGEGDVVNGFAAPYTALVIADLLGVPVEDREGFVATIQNQHGGGVGNADQGMAKSPLEFLYQNFVGYIEDRRTNPRNDVLTEMAQATFPDGSTPDVMDVVRVAANLFSAGQETTVRLLGSALRTIAENPEIQRELRADRTKIPNFIEESLRHESPIKGDFRLSKVPVTVGDVDLPAGTTVMLINGAANRDPRRFPEPEKFDLNRENARHHVAFGRGIHTCPGAPLARAEGRAAIERILALTSDIRISEKVHGPADDRTFTYLPTFILRGLINLQLEFDLAEPKKD